MKIVPEQIVLQIWLGWITPSPPSSNTLNNVQKIRVILSRSENSDSSFTMVIYENFFLVYQVFANYLMVHKHFC